MPIPPFGPAGTLAIPDPVGEEVPGRVAFSHLALVPATLAEVHQRFVVETPDHSVREELWAAWMRLRRSLEEFQIVLHTWLGGSFLSTRTHPGDIDLCLIFDGADFGLLERAEQEAFAALIQSAKPDFRCHLFPLTIYPIHHPRYVQSCMGYNYWTRVFGVDRAGNQVSMLMISERGTHE